MEKAKKISLFVLLLLSISFASAIGNEVPIQIQVTDSDGDIQTGTFTFTINISNSITCSPVLFSNVTTLTTDARGIVSYNIQLDLDFSEQYYLCYYRDDVLKETKTIGVTPYAFRSNISNHLVSTNNYEMANLTLGQKITFAFDEIIDNIVDGWIRITGNLNVTENLTVEGNAIIDKYLHLYPGANQNLANEFSDDGAIFVGGDAFFNKGASLQSRQYGYGLMVQDYNIPGIINRTSDTGEFTGATQYFCDYTTGFTQTDIDENRAVVFGHDALYPLVSDIKLLINSDCVELDIATSDVLPDFNTSYYVMQSPTLFITDGGHAHISIGEHDNSHLMITTANGTGADNVLIDDVSGANNRRSLGILTDSKDYTGISGLNVLMYSSTGVNEITSQALKLSGDAKGFNNSDLRFIDIDLISAGSENTVIGMNIEGSITHIINQGKAQVLDSAWYDDTTSTTNMTDYFTSLTNDATLFEDQNSYIYIGNSHNFTRVGVSLMTGASHTIIPEYYYCNSAGNWDTLNGITDTTDGFTKAGSIIFINPSDRGVCNKEVDGTPFADAADYTYIAIKRTRNLLPTSPVENLISIGGGATNFFLDEDVIRLVPVASPPYTCTSAYQGAIYSDSATVELLWCDGTSWQAFAETSDVTNHNKLSGIQGGTATEYYHLTSAQHSLATGDNYLLNTGDTATGNYTFDTDTFFIDSSNNRVGIGTSSPGTELEVNGDIGIGRVAGGYTFRESVGGGVRAGIYSDATNELIFKYGADVEGMRIDASGDVGIGTSSPSRQLHLSGTGSTDGSIHLENSGGGNFSLITFDSANTFSIYDETNTAHRLTILDGGNVGIGTSTPQNTLNVIGDGNFTGLIYGNGSQLTGISSTDTNASTACSGSTTYLDGEGNCDDISSVYAPVNYGDDWNETYANTLYRLDSWDNFTGIPTATPSDGDTTHLSTADQIRDYVVGLAYATTSYVDNLVSSVGNWTADKSDYATNVKVDSLGNFSDWDKDYSDLINTPTFANDTWVDTYFVRFTELVGQIGNWSNDKADYSTTATIDAYSLSHWSDDLGNRGYTSNLNFTNDAGYLTSYTETDSLAYNGTLAYNSSLSNYYLNSNPSNYWNDTYASFNKTYADGLYADISVTGDNSSFNQSLTNTLYYRIENPSSYYNSTDFSISSYSTTAEILDFNYLNDTNYPSLINNSIANTLHRHSELVASDGSPDPALSVDASGNVGIGTASPDVDLHVKRTGSSAQIKVETVTSGVASFSLADQTGGTFIVRGDGGDSYFNTGGNVGIGTASPGTELEVNGDIGIGRVAGGYTFRESVGGGVRAGIYSDATNELIFKYGADVEGMRIDASGNVGIGTASPTTKLDIIPTASAYGGVMVSDGSSYETLPSSATTNDPSIILHRWTGGGTNVYGASMFMDSDDLVFASAPSGTAGSLTWTERMRIDSDGKVGIGTASPFKLLEVATSDTSNTFAGDATIHVGNSETAAFGRHSSITFGTGTEIGAGISGIYDNYDATNKVGHELAFYTKDSATEATPSEQMRIDKGGNVGIGTSSPVSALDIGTAAPSGLLTFTGTHGGGGEGIAYEDSGGVSRYALNFPGSDIVAFSNRASNGVVQIRANTATAGSGGEVTAIVVEDNEIQLLPSGGNVGIGTSSPDTLLNLAGANEAVRIEASADTTNRIEFGQDTSILGGYINMNRATGQFQLQQAGTAKFVLDGSGKVGIGTASPLAKLHSHESSVLGGTTGNNQLISEFSTPGGSTGNTVRHREYAYRDATGTAWTTWRLHDAISVDSSFATPGTDTKVWWERDPQHDIQSWGNAASTYMTINAGNVGIGTSSPSSTLEVNGGVNIGGTGAIADNNLYVVGDVSALTFTDRTPFYDGDALNEIVLISGIDGEINHSSLPEFVKVEKNVTIYEVQNISEEVFNETSNKTENIIVEKEVAVGVEPVTERNLGNMISVLVKGIQELFNWNTEQDNEIIRIKQCTKNSSSWETYQNCVNPIEIK